MTPAPIVKLHGSQSGAALLMELRTIPPPPSASEWAEVGFNVLRVIARCRADTGEKVRQLKRLSILADNMAETLAAPFNWPPKGGAR